MKIGIFDSGVGGLIVTHAIINHLPQYDTLYLGDTARVPYGNRLQSEILQFSLDAVDYLFRHDCQVIIIACNTASAEALRHIQHQWLPHHYPDRRVLGVLIPSAESAVEVTLTKRVGVLATTATVQSGAFIREIHKLDRSIHILQQAAPRLVPLIESANFSELVQVLHEDLQPFIDSDIDTLILGSTHYAWIKEQIQSIVGPKIKLISQSDVVPKKLEDYLKRHPEIDAHLKKESNHQFCVTKLTDEVSGLGKRLFGEGVTLTEICL